MLPMYNRRWEVYDERSLPRTRESTSNTTGLPWTNGKLISNNIAEYYIENKLNKLFLTLLRKRIVYCRGLQKRADTTLQRLHMYILLSGIFFHYDLSKRK